MFMSDEFRLKVALITNDATWKLCVERGDMSQAALASDADNFEPFLDKFFVLLGTVRCNAVSGNNFLGAMSHFSLSTFRSAV